ncbi:MAG: hypothetical protein ABI903_16475 [Actinomycetota bacterium]
MRRREPESKAGDLVPFVAPVGDVREVWEAFRAWEADLMLWELKHPEQAAQIDAVRSVSMSPDEPLRQPYLLMYQRDRPDLNRWSDGIIGVRPDGAESTI